MSGLVLHFSACFMKTMSIIWTEKKKIMKQMAFCWKLYLCIFLYLMYDKIILLIIGKIYNKMHFTTYALLPLFWAHFYKMNQWYNVRLHK